MKKVGGKDATNAILANLRGKIFKIFPGIMHLIIYLTRYSSDHTLNTAV